MSSDDRERTIWATSTAQLTLVVTRDKRGHACHDGEDEEGTVHHADVTVAGDDGRVHEYLHRGNWKRARFVTGGRMGLTGGRARRN